MKNVIKKLMFVGVLMLGLAGTAMADGGYGHRGGHHGPNHNGHHRGHHGLHRGWGVIIAGPDGVTIDIVAGGIRSIIAVGPAGVIMAIMVIEATEVTTAVVGRLLPEDRA